MSEHSAEKPEVLVVDDSKVIRLAARKMLGNDYVIHLAEDGLVGWEMLQNNSALSVVFTDLSMPNLNGMELLNNIRSSSDDQIASLPVIIMTGHDDTDSVKQEVFDAGATDFITKPFESIDLLSRAKAFARLSRKVVELEKKTGYDKLTGLHNANSLQEQGAKAFSFSSRHALNISAIHFEIKDFQDIFLNFGKNIAQHIIVAVGKRLQEVMREEDIAARIAVAKYALVLPMTNKHSAETVINRVRESIDRLVFDTGKDKIRVNFVAGYASLNHAEDYSFTDLMEQTDDALQQALNSTTQKVICFNEEGVVEEPVVEKPVAVVTEQDIEKAFSHILEGNFYQIPGHQLVAVMERLTPFIQYVKNQNKAEQADNLTKKDVAL